jgi:hypothetical protein
MNFWIVAVDHTLQLVEEPDDSQEMKEQKNHLTTLLREEIPKRAVRFITEESARTKTTIASTFAKANDPEIRWKNIVMTEAERDAAGIKEALKNRPGRPDEMMERWIEFRVPEDEIRETFFIQQTLDDAIGAQSVLMLLGDMHVESVAKKLAKMGHRVETNHDLVPVKRWADPEPSISPWDSPPATPDSR